jgi:hypothetical protein
MRKTPVVLGIVSMALGGLASFGGLMGIVAQPLARAWMGLLGDLMSRAPHRPGQPDPAESMRRTTEAMEGIRDYQIAVSATLVVLSLAVVVIGFGLYRRKRWARPAAIAWGVLALCYVALMTWFQAAVVQPQIQQAMHASLHGDSPVILDAVGRAQSVISVVTSVGFYAPFPVIVLLLMGRRSAKADLTS